MEYLARKISRPKWEPKPYTGPEDVRADAITGCLRTLNDTLSLWQCSQDNADVADVALALAASMEKIEGMHVVLLPKSDLSIDGFSFEVTPEHANTPVEDLCARHVDLVNLTMTLLCSLARRIATNVRQGLSLYQFTRREVRDILCRAVKAARVDINSLKNDVRSEIQKHL